MKSYKTFSTSQIIELLSTATLFKRIQWTRMTDYLFFNGQNKAIVNFANMFSHAKPPVMLDDVPTADLMKSYYCEYEGAAFCLMYCAQVLKAEESPQNFYNFMIQSTPFNSFGYYSNPEDSFQESLKRLASLAEMQVFASYSDVSPLFRALSKLQDSVNSFDPQTEEVLSPPLVAPDSSYKHSCVIDKNDDYVDFVLVLIEADENGISRENVQHYKLEAGQKLIDVAPPSSTLIKAHWTGTSWEESASQGEIEKYYRSHRF